MAYCKKTKPGEMFHWIWLTIYNYYVCSNIYFLIWIEGIESEVKINYHEQVASMNLTNLCLQRELIHTKTEIISIQQPISQNKLTTYCCYKQ